MSGLNFYPMPRQRTPNSWPKCGEKSTLHALVICYFQVGNDYFLFCGQESNYIKLAGTDIFKPNVTAIETNPALINDHCTHVVLRHCERTKAGSGPIGSLSESYTVQIPTPKNMWGFPKGGNQRTESYQECALREVWEETDNLLDLKKLSNGSQTPTMKYQSSGTPGLAFFYEMSQAEANEFLKNYAVLNLRREGELFHGNFYSISYIYNTLMPVMNNVSRNAFLQFLVDKGVATPVPGGARKRKTQTRRLQKRKTG
jgi:hypothetical protein